MKVRICLYLLVSIFFFSTSCSESTTDTKTKDEDTVVNIKSRPQSDIAKRYSLKIVGRWESMRDSLFYDFKDDYTYSFGYVDNLKNEKISEEGTWFIDDNMMIFSFKDSQRTERLNFMNDIVYFGIVPDTFYPENKNLDKKATSYEELLTNFGYSKKE